MLTGQVILRVGFNRDGVEDNAIMSRILNAQGHGLKILKRTSERLV
ncbi:hypothetical protein SSCHL_1800 [Staphylococcus schleiferi]|nr:hypothetical protein SSCHL_1800 [Staphylococcus schleiferi]